MVTMAGVSETQRWTSRAVMRCFCPIRSGSGTPSGVITRDVTVDEGTTSVAGSDGVAVVSAFQNVPSHRLQDLAHDVECDVIVSGAKAPRERVMVLCRLIPGMRAVDGGPLANARYVEGWTALLIGLNVRYKVSEGMGFRLTHLPGGA